ncbi:uncharacterized protein LOC135502532 [Lineus longissimus]|uniref:uncharacterized protein LOC135502532 n=1 Tax=Lineus longissimus TaxID=88925 RepID=UPI00315D939E
MYHFGYLGMKSRLQLAGLHFNENSGRDQAKLKNGEEQFNISFPKFKKGDFSVKRVLTKCTFNYVTELQKEVCRIIRAGEICQNEEPPPPPLSSAFEHPDKQEAINKYRSGKRYVEHVGK